MTHLSAPGAVLTLMLGLGFVLMGLATLSDWHGYGTRTVEGIPKVFRMGSVSAHRKVLGAGWLAFGALLAAIGIGLSATLL